MENIEKDECEEIEFVSDLQEEKLIEENLEAVDENVNLETSIWVELIKFLNTKTFKIVSGVMIVLQISAFLFGVAMLYYLENPDIKYAFDENLFSGNCLIADDERVSEICDILENELDIDVEEEYLDEYLLLNAIYENDNLSDMDKEIFYGFIDMIKDNPYINKEKAYRALNNVYIECIDRPDDVSVQVMGDYNRFFKRIRLFYTGNDVFNLDGTVCHQDKYKELVGHEGGHCIFEISNLPAYFYEGMTELLVNEYFSKNPYVEAESYPFQILAVKMLCEVTSPDTVLKAFSFDDMSIITSGIADIIGNKEEAQEAMENLGVLFDYLDKEEIGKFKEAEGTKFIEVFRNCISIKYPDITDPNSCAYYYNEMLFNNVFEGKDAFYKYAEFIIDEGALIRSYFSSKLIKLEQEDDYFAKLLKDKRKSTEG